MSDHHQRGHHQPDHPVRHQPVRQQPPDGSAFLETIILLLMPYFLGTAGTVAGARIEILRTLTSYAACTRPSVLLAAQLIALGVTTLDALHEARTIEMSVPMRLRYRSNANSLTRTMLRTEESLQAALADETTPEPVETEPTSAKPTPAEPVQAAAPASITEPTAQPDADPAAAARVAATVMDALRSMGLAPPPGAAPPGRSEPPARL